MIPTSIPPKIAKDTDTTADAIDACFFVNVIMLYPLFVDYGDIVHYTISPVKYYLRFN
jgi:hypothetical protein